MKAVLFRCCVVLVVATRNLAVAQHVQSTDCLCYRHRPRTACRAVLRVAVRPVSSELSCTCVCVCARSSCFGAHRPMSELAASGGRADNTARVAIFSSFLIWSYCVPAFCMGLDDFLCTFSPTLYGDGPTHAHCMHVPCAAAGSQHYHFCLDSFLSLVLDLSPCHP